jgi:hypothetical protein
MTRDPAILSYQTNAGGVVSGGPEGAEGTGVPAPVNHAIPSAQANQQQKREGHKPERKAAGRVGTGTHNTVQKLQHAQSHVPNALVCSSMWLGTNLRARTHGFVHRVICVLD